MTSNRYYGEQYKPLSTIKAQSECSSVVCVVRIELYGSTTAVEICGAG